MVDMMIIRDDVTRSGTRYSDAISVSIVRRLRGVIQRRFHEPDFDLTEAAKACMVSTRQLQAVLQKHSSTFSRELLETRLSAAARMLRSRDCSVQQIGAVAEASGFSSQAHFAYRYRERFGHSPSAERRLAGGIGKEIAPER